MKKYMVYIDDGENVYKIAMSAENVREAREKCEGNGEIIAIKDVTDFYSISGIAVKEALIKADFRREAIDFIVRALEAVKMVEF